MPIQKKEVDNPIKTLQELFKNKDIVIPANLNDTSPFNKPNYRGQHPSALDREVILNNRVYVDALVGRKNNEPKTLTFPVSATVEKEFLPYKSSKEIYVPEAFKAAVAKLRANPDASLLSDSEIKLLAKFVNQSQSINDNRYSFFEDVCKGLTETALYKLLCDVKNIMALSHLYYGPLFELEEKPYIRKLLGNQLFLCLIEVDQPALDFTEGFTQEKLKLIHAALKTFSRVLSENCYLPNYLQELFKFEVDIALQKINQFNSKQPFLSSGPKYLESALRINIPDLDQYLSFVYNPAVLKQVYKEKIGRNEKLKNSTFLVIRRFLELIKDKIYKPEENVSASIPEKMKLQENVSTSIPEKMQETPQKKRKLELPFFPPAPEFENISLSQEDLRDLENFLGPLTP